MKNERAGVIFLSTNEGKGNTDGFTESITWRIVNLKHEANKRTSSPSSYYVLMVCSRSEQIRHSPNRVAEYEAKVKSIPRKNWLLFSNLFPELCWTFAMHEKQFHGGEGVQAGQGLRPKARSRSPEKGNGLIFSMASATGLRA